MGLISVLRTGVPGATLLLAAMLAGGCQVNDPHVPHRLVNRQAFLDFSGLDEKQNHPALKMSCALPETWKALSMDKTALYTHQQWKSPSGHTGLGVVYIHMPLPLAAKTVAWFAKREYTRHDDEGRLINEWCDELGRYWFEAENEKYHVRGFVVTEGFDAWVIYLGYKKAYEVEYMELALAGRSLETVAPDSKMKSPAGAAH